MKIYVCTNTTNDKKIILKNNIEYIKTGKNQPKDKKKGEKYPYYGTNGITGYTDEYLFKGEHILTPRNGTIGLIFKVSGKFFPSDHVYVIKLNNNININFIYYYLINCVDLDSKKHGSTIPGITRKDIENIELSYPSLGKQEKIIKYCDNLSDMISKMEKQIESNKKLMKKVMKRYLTVPKEKTKKGKIITDEDDVKKKSKIITEEDE